MRRASKLSTAEDFAIEERREGIRNTRTRRVMSIILCFSLALTLPGLDDDFTQVLAALFHAVVSG
ncbi:MAG TPA: hypothetical protein VIV13_02475 [Solirubrobacterales bacterium]